MCSPVRNGLMILFATLLSVPAWATDYVQAAGSSLVFAGTYQGEVFTGRFPGFDTRLAFDPDHLDTSSLRVSIPLATATTANSDYDGEMRGASFFNAARFPTAQSRRQPLRGRRHAVPAWRQQAGDAAVHVDARGASGAGGQGHGAPP